MQKIKPEKIIEKNKSRIIIIPRKVDNQGSIALTYNLVFYAKIKYINIQHHYIYDLVIT